MRSIWRSQRCSMQRWSPSSRPCKARPGVANNRSFLVEQFDYVIVGAGPAGCVLANRLSVDPGKRVLLLESGPRDNHPLIHMPKGIGKLRNDPRYMWSFDVYEHPASP